MMSNHSALISLILCSLSAVSCGQARQTQKCAIIADADDGKTVTVANGAMICVKLPVLPATGFLWYPYDPSEAFVQVGDSRFEPDDSKKGQPGNSETQIFRFVAKKSGSHEITFVYSRQNNILKKLTFKINVR